MIEMEEFDDSDYHRRNSQFEIEFHIFPLNFYGFYKKAEKNEESVKATQTSLIFYKKELEFHCDKNCNSHKTFN